LISENSQIKLKDLQINVNFSQIKMETL